MPRIAAAAAADGHLKGGLTRPGRNAGAEAQDTPGGWVVETLQKRAWSALTLAMFLAFLEILARRTDPG